MKELDRRIDVLEAMQRQACKQDDPRRVAAVAAVIGSMTNDELSELLDGSQDSRSSAAARFLASVATHMSQTEIAAAPVTRAELPNDQPA